MSVFSLHLLQRDLDGNKMSIRKLLVAVLPLLLILGLTSAPLASAQSSTYTLEPGDTATHDGEDYTCTELVGGQSCKIYYNGTESSDLAVDNTIGDLKIIKIAGTYVILEGQAPEEPEDEEEEEPPAPIAEKRYTLSSGDILLFTDDAGVNGAAAYLWGEALAPTFLFWSGGRLPTINKTPTPNERVSLRVGQSYDAGDVVWGLIVTVESVNGDEVVVVCETDDSVSLMKTVVGGTDVSDIVDQLKLWLQTQQPPVTPPSAPVNLAGITVVALLAVIVFCFNEFYWKPRRTWGQGL